MGFDFGDTLAGRLLNSLMPDGRGNGLLPGLRPGEGNGDSDDGPDGPHHRGGPHGNDAPHGTGNPHGHHGPYAPGDASPRAQSPDVPQTGGPAQPQSMDMDAPPTGGPAPKGMQEVPPNIVSQLMSDVRTLLQSSASEVARAASAGNGPAAAGAQQAAAARHGHGHAPAQVASATTVASAVPATAAAAATAATAAPASQAASANAVANAASPTLAQPASSVPRMPGDGMIVPMPNRPADTALAARVDNALLASLASSLQPASAPPTLAVPTALATPGSTMAAMAGSAQGATMAAATATTAAGLTMATSVSQPVDARGVILPVNDRASVRLESLGLAGHTLEGLQRRSMRTRAQAMLPQRMTRWLWAMGLMGAQASDADEDPGRDVQRVLQWLFWMLALVAYGCLAVAIVALVGSNGHLFDQPQGRSYTGWLAFFGLLTGTVAWWLARRMTRR